MFTKTDLTEGNVTKGLLTYFVPILFGGLFQQLYNTVDAFVVGRFVGTQALAAVGGSAAQVVNLLIGFFSGLAGGATVIIAHYYGANDKRKLKSALHTTIAFAFCVGIFLTVVGIGIAPSFLKLLRVPEDTLTYSVQYVRVIFAGVIPGFLYNMGSGILRAMGDSKRPLYYLILCCATNIVLDLLFVIVFKWEVLGVAAATALSQVLSAILVLLNLSKLDEDYALRLHELRIDRQDLTDIVKIGFPAAIQSSMYSISNLLIISSVNLLGTVSVAAWTATSKTDSLYWVVTNAFGTTVLTFVGQNLGAKKEDRAKEGVRKCLMMEIAASALISTVLFTFAGPLLSIFTKDANVVSHGIVIMRYMVPLYVMWSLVEVFGGALRGAGDAFWPMVITMIGICGLRVLWLLIVVPLFPGIRTICLSYPITWVVTGVSLCIYYLKRGLKNRLTHE